MTLEATRALLEARLGQEVHLSDWVEVSQARIDAFADATGDRQWIHVDPARAARESPWKTTVAHGFLTLALLPVLRGVEDGGADRFPGVRRIINYGLNRVRFMNAVPAGARVRGRARLVALEPFPGGLVLTEEMTIEVEGETRPACVAQTIARLYF